MAVPVTTGVESLLVNWVTVGVAGGEVATTSPVEKGGLRNVPDGVTVLAVITYLPSGKASESGICRVQTKLFTVKGPEPLV